MNFDSYLYHSSVQFQRFFEQNLRADHFMLERKVVKLPGVLKADFNLYPSPELPKPRIFGLICAVFPFFRRIY